MYTFTLMYIPGIALVAVKRNEVRLVFLLGYLASRSLSL